MEPTNSNSHTFGLTLTTAWSDDLSLPFVKENEAKILGALEQFAISNGAESLTVGTITQEPGTNVKKVELLFEGNFDPFAHVDELIDIIRKLGPEATDETD